MKLFMVEGFLNRGVRSWMLQASTAVLILGFLLLGTLASAQKDSNIFPKKPEPAVYVHDYSGWLAPQEKSALEQKLRAYHDSTTTQIVVMIRSDIGDYDKASYAFELGNQWGIGRGDKDNGVVMLIKTEAPERGIFIATGYGTEGALPDITAGRIIRNTMGPYFRQQQYYQGINAGLDDIIQALSGEFQSAPGGKPMGTGTAILIVLFIALIFFVVVGTIVYRLRKYSQWITHDGSKRVNRRDRDDGFGGGWWMGGGGSGGGFGGGGGSWGGGGGGGSFGGGSFGGGGAGGDW